VNRDATCLKVIAGSGELQVSMDCPPPSANKNIGNPILVGSRNSAREYLVFIEALEGYKK
jgi:hypothetical protein